MSNGVPYAAPPALDDLFDERAVGIVRPGSAERRSGTLGPAILRQHIAADAHRNRDAFANDDCFAVAQRRQEVHQPVRRFGHRAAYNLLIDLVGHAQGKERITLGQEVRGEVRRALADRTAIPRTCGPLWRSATTPVWSARSRVRGRAERTGAPLRKRL